MLQVYKLYPQYQIKTDRRQQSAPVNLERRSGTERRSNDRIKLDTNLTRDIFELKNSAAIIAKNDYIQPGSMWSGVFKSIPLARKIFNPIEATKNPEIVNQIKNSNPSNNSLKKEQKSSDTALVAGMMVNAISGAFGSILFGAVGVIMGLGLGLYFGCKSVKNVILSHLKVK